MAILYLSLFHSTSLFIKPILIAIWLFYLIIAPILLDRLSHKVFFRYIFTSKSFFLAWNLIILCVLITPFIYAGSFSNIFAWIIFINSLFTGLSTISISLLMYYLQGRYTTKKRHSNFLKSSLVFITSLIVSIFFIIDIIASNLLCTFFYGFYYHSTLFML
ncbi:hypothetical protein CQA53_08835 [Helicobacter didelphidarum]|uniref:Uncharacterized protein n=1 Tax=Helicobacter didelphidarum TaxID=2040648 RepID=A0A3D8ICZ9_9HELI|nr:hypothetical protein [Helicobacter didelphidarum]RDU62915.1 hypothetical protein CQA53_08835 [Helicobacter didelphidarum]